MPEKSIHGRIRERREALGLSQQRLGELLHVSYQTIQQWEREPGTRPDGSEIQSTAPKRVRLAQVAAILGVTPEWLMSGRDGDGNVLDPTEAQMILFYRGISDDMREHILSLLNGMYNAMNPAKRTAANPYPGKKPPRK